MTIPIHAYEERINDVLNQPEELIKLLEALAAEPASNGMRKQLKHLIAKLRTRIDARQFLSDPILCSWLPIVMSSQRSSELDTGYAHALTQILDERTRRRGLIAAFSYPLVLLGFTMGVLVPMCIFVVPPFQKMFIDFGLRLPWPTVILFRIADMLNNHAIALILTLGMFIGLIALAVYAWVSRALTTRLIGWLIAGNSVSLIAMSRLTSVLAELLELGAPITDALQLAGRASRHAYFDEAARDLAVHLSDPNFTWQSSPVAHNFPLTFLHALSAGEGNQVSVPLLRQLSHAYGHRVSARMNRRMGMSSPLVIVAIGLVVGLTVFAIFLPLVGMMHSLA